MIKIENGENLYYIENIGCDDETHGLAKIKDEDFPAFAEIIKNLNKNSTYDCMPTIRVLKIKEDWLREATEDDADYRVLYFGDEKYVIDDGITWSFLYKEGEAVI